MKYRRLSALLFLVASAAAACSGAPEESAPATADQSPLVITAKTPTLVEGTFTDRGGSFYFRSAEIAPSKVDVTVRAGQTNLVLHLDYAQGQGDFDASAGQLDEAQVGSMLHLLTALAKALPSEESTAIKALGRTVNFLSVAPVAEPLPAFTFVSENGWAYLSCGCGWQDAYGYHNWMGKGESCGSSASPHCPGRCGVGCGPDNLWFWWESGTYTADCARHDYGVGSWGAASDDYLFASHNCW